MSAYQFPLLIKHILRTPLTQAGDQQIISDGLRRYDYQGLNARVARGVSLFQSLGVKKGSVVAVLDWDTHRYFECFFAVPLLGAVLHTVNVRLSPEQILYTINHAQDDVILCHVDFLPILAAISKRIERPYKLIILNDDGTMPEGVTAVGEYEALISRSDPVTSYADFDENTIATLFYTTGTTGDPKGVQFSHRQLVLHTLGVASGMGSVAGCGLHRGDVYMPITPLFHVHAWGIPYVATMLGLKQIYPGRYEPAKLLALIQEHDVTFSHCVPTILSMLLHAPEAEKTDLSRWKVIIGGAALSEGLAQEAIDRGIDIHAAYGMSETCPFLTVADMHATRHQDAPIDIRTATGKAAPLVELRIVDEEMNDVAHDGVAKGEIVARAPWLTQGYVRDAAQTAALWRGGWMHTGDIATMDAHGTIRIKDRLKDVIKSGGEWISSLELENIASTVDVVIEVAAIGVPDEKWGERPKLFVVISGKGDDALAALRAVFLQAAEKGSLSKWAMPQDIEIIEEIPKTSVGKIDKKQLRLMA